jgi:uncharacterized phage protein (TIGR02218 family)
MRRSVPAAFKNYLLTKIAKTLVRCWKVTLHNGTVKGFTTNTRDITVGGVLYQSITGLTTSSVKYAEGLSVDNMVISAFLSAQDEQDILKGLYDGAMLEVFVVNYLDLSLGFLTEKVGFLGEITRADGVFQAELRGLMDMLRTKIGRVYTAACDARLGDARCGIPLSSFQATMTTVTGPKSFQAAAIAGVQAGWFTDGYLVFLTGNNTGVVRDIRFHAGVNIDLFLSPPYPLVVNDIVNMFVGCDKTKQTCITKFNNVLNFRGFDFVPTLEQVFDSPVNLQPSLTVCATDDPGYQPDPVVAYVPNPPPPPQDSGGDV